MKGNKICFERASKLLFRVLTDIFNRPHPSKSQKSCVLEYYLNIIYAHTFCRDIWYWTAIDLSGAPTLQKKHKKQ